MWYTKNGDDGYTDLVGGERVAKDSRRIEAVGSLDEATSCIGAARAQLGPEAAALLARVQRELILLMAEVAAPDPLALRARLPGSAVAALEADIEAVAAGVPPLTDFVLPGDTPAGAALDVARAVVRRAERRVVALLHHGELQHEHLVRYLNRLSSLLYFMARAEDEKKA
ncbi:MAG: cob(I)yrinic acid a,c-diamide adenosyltransferase [Armatimonadota bacterium]